MGFFVDLMMNSCGVLESAVTLFRNNNTDDLMLQLLNNGFYKPSCTQPAPRCQFHVCLRALQLTSM